MTDDVMTENPGAAGGSSTDEDLCPHDLPVRDCQPCEEAAILAGDAPALTCGRCGRSVAALVADDYELICELCDAGYTLDEMPLPLPVPVPVSVPLPAAVPVAACDGASVGVMVSDLEGRWLMFERVKFPPGVAPVAGHVFDEHAEPGADPDEAYEAAARAEVAEEVGLSVVSLVDTGIGGWRANRCRRPAGPGGTGHQWRIYRATVTGELAPSPAETRHPQWLTRAHLQQLAQVTVAYARGALDQEDWAARPGIEPVWVQWLVQLGLVDVHPGDLALVDRVAAGEPAPVAPVAPVVRS